VTRDTKETDITFKISVEDTFSNKSGDLEHILTPPNGEYKQNNETDQNESPLVNTDYRNFDP